MRHPSLGSAPGWPPARPQEGRAEDTPRGAEGAGPLILCLNPGWGGRALVKEGLSWTGRTGTPAVFAYVVVRRGRSRLGMRGATRAIRWARDLARRHERTVGETVVLADSVAEGLRLAQAALGGHVGLCVRDRAHHEELRAADVPVLDVAW